MKQTLELTKERYAEALNMVRLAYESGGKALTLHDAKKIRTIPQNSSLHEYCEQLARKLNAGGYTVKVVMNRRVQEALKNAESELTRTKELGPNQKGFVLTWIDYIKDSVFIADSDWTKELVKNLLWRKLQTSMFNKKSTTRLTTIETQEVYKQLDKVMGESFGVHVEWPSKESLSEQQRAA